jgi:hypothetical protein
LKGREWWVKSKKEGEGGKFINYSMTGIINNFNVYAGQLEDYMQTLPFENYDVMRGHINFNKFGKRRDTVRTIGLLKAVIRVCLKNPRYDTGASISRSHV